MVGFHKYVQIFFITWITTNIFKEVTKYYHLSWSRRVVGGICNLALLRQDNICSHQCLNANITTHIRKPLGKSYKLALQFYVPALVYFLRCFSWVAEVEGLILGPAGVGLDVFGFEVSPSNCWDAWSCSIREGIWKLHSDSTPQPLTV